MNLIHKDSQSNICEYEIINFIHLKILRMVLRYTHPQTYK